jgi:hypothetical protein
MKGIESQPSKDKRILNNALPGVVPTSDRSKDSTKIQLNGMTNWNANSLPFSENAVGKNMPTASASTTVYAVRSNILAQYLIHGRTCRPEL